MRDSGEGGDVHPHLMLTLTLTQEWGWDGVGCGGKGWDEVVWCGDVSLSPHPHIGWGVGGVGWVGCNGVVS
jgi:hypothetical protein